MQTNAGHLEVIEIALQCASTSKATFPELSDVARNALNENRDALRRRITSTAGSLLCTVAVSVDAQDNRLTSLDQVADFWAAIVDQLTILGGDSSDTNASQMSILFSSLDVSSNALRRLTSKSGTAAAHLACLGLERLVCRDNSLAVVQLSANDRHLFSGTAQRLLAGLAARNLADATTRGVDHSHLRRSRESLVSSISSAIESSAAGSVIGDADTFSLSRPPSGAGHWFASLLTLDLSGNLLTDFPDVTACACLEELHLANNQLRHLRGLGQRVTFVSNSSSGELGGAVSRLRLLDISDNELNDFRCLIDISHVATSLTHLAFVGNPFCPRLDSATTKRPAGPWDITDLFEVRCFASFNAPLLATVNGVALTVAEISTANRLFRVQQDPAGDLDSGLFELLDVGDDDQEDDAVTEGGEGSASSVRTEKAKQLVAYLALHCRNLDKKKSSADSNRRPDRVSAPSDGSTSLATSQDGDLAMLLQQFTAATGDGVSPPPQHLLAMLLGHLVKRVSAMHRVVKVLHEGDLCRRRLAALCIQRHYRAHLVRRMLPQWFGDGPEAEGGGGDSALSLLQRQQRMLRHRGSADMWKLVESSTSRLAAPVHADTSTTVATTAPPSLASKVQALETILRQLFTENQTLRRYYHCQVASCAIRIQRWYRSRASIRELRRLKQEYHRFRQEHYQVPATMIQSVVRGFLQRRRFRRQLTARRQQRQLVDDVNMLKEQVAFLTSLLSSSASTKRAATVGMAAAKITGTTAVAHGATATADAGTTQFSSLPSGSEGRVGLPVENARDHQRSGAMMGVVHADAPSHYDLLTAPRPIPTPAASASASNESRYQAVIGNMTSALRASLPQSDASVPSVSSSNPLMARTGLPRLAASSHGDPAADVRQSLSPDASDSSGGGAASGSLWRSSAVGRYAMSPVPRAADPLPHSNLFASVPRGGSAPESVSTPPFMASSLNPIKMSEPL